MGRAEVAVAALRSRRHLLFMATPRGELPRRAWCSMPQLQAAEQHLSVRSDRGQAAAVPGHTQRVALARVEF